MTYIAAVLIASFALTWYWLQCRKNSLRHRQQVAELLEAAYQAESLSDKEADTLHAMFRMARHWFFMPLFAVVTPIFLLIELIVSKGNLSLAPRHGEHFQKIMDGIVAMAFSRNPCISAVCMSASIVFIMAFSVVGFMLQRLGSLPSLSQLFELAATGLMKTERHRHAH